MAVLHISHGGDDRDPDWFVVHPLEGRTRTSVAGTPVTHAMEISSLLNARRAVFEVDTVALTVMRLEPGTGGSQIPAGGTWRLEGYDTFSGEPYPLGGPLDGLEPEYPTREAALDGARKRLADLERTQPSASSGGQAGVQDRVYIVHPDGHRERVTARPRQQP